MGFNIGRIGTAIATGGMSELGGARPLIQSATGKDPGAFGMNVLGGNQVEKPVTAFDMTRPYYEQIFDKMGGPNGVMNQSMTPNADLRAAWGGIADRARNNNFMDNAQYNLQAMMNSRGTQAQQANGDFSLMGGLASGRQQVGGFLGQTLRGNYNNPYLGQMYNMAARDLTSQFGNAVNAADTTAMASGRYGSNAWSNQREAANNAYAQGLGDLGTKIYGGAYESERARQFSAQQQAATQQADAQQYMTGANLQNQQYNASNRQNQNQFDTNAQLQAIGMAPAMNQAGYYGLQQLQGVGEARAQYPWTQLQNGANILGVANGVPNPLQQQKGPSMIGSLLGAGAGAFLGGPAGAGIGMSLGGMLPLG